MTNKPDTNFPSSATYTVAFDERMLAIWHDAKTGDLTVVLYVGVDPFGKHSGAYEITFPDSETQNSDAERWANDFIGYPNPVAGLFMFEMWNPTLEQLEQWNPDTERFEAIA
jgi:hypothetical protein